jgi:hypothetical protein
VTTPADAASGVRRQRLVVTLGLLALLVAAVVISRFILRGPDCAKYADVFAAWDDAARARAEASGHADAVRLLDARRIAFRQRAEGLCHEHFRDHLMPPAEYHRLRGCLGERLDEANAFLTALPSMNPFESGVRASKLQSLDDCATPPRAAQPAPPP